MIVELFGPPGSGKTTFAHALARQLRSSGFRADVVLSFQPSGRSSRLDHLGVGLFALRILSALFSTIGILMTEKGRRKYLGQSLSIVRSLPPTNPLWRARLWQYILHLSKCWDEASDSPDIIIFDQGYLQAIGSLAIFNGSADIAAMSNALALAPEADIAIRVVMPPAVVEQRLHARRSIELPAERLFEADIGMNMRSIRIFEDISRILSGSSRRVTSTDTFNQPSFATNLARIQREILELQAKPESVNHHVSNGGSAKVMFDGKANGSETAAIPRQASEIPARKGPERREEGGRRLAFSSMFALAIYICGAGVTSVAQFAIARVTGTVDYGIYSYALAWASVLAYLSTLGFNVSLLRFVPAYRASGRLDLARGVLHFALSKALTAAAIVAGVGSVLIIFHSEPGSEGEVSLLLGMATVPFVTAYALGASIVRAFGGVVSALLPERVVRDGSLLLLVGVFALTGSRTPDASLVMIAVLASSAITTVLVFVTALRLLPAGIRNAQSSSLDAPRWWSAVPPIMLLTGLDVFITRTGVMVLGWGGYIREAGVFALGLNVALLVGLSRIAVSTMFSPTAADLHARTNYDELQVLFARATMLCAAGALAMAVPLLIIAEWLLAWFGDDFVAGAPIARILIIGYLIVAAFGPQINLLTMTGNEWPAALIMVAGAIVSAAACAAGVRLFGAVGAAIGITLAMAVWNVAMAIHIRRSIGILPGLIHAGLTLGSQALGGRRQPHGGSAK